jgi:hypothetical protein
MTKHKQWSILIVLVILVQLACNMPSRSQPVESGAGAIYTAAAHTVEAQMTQVSKPPATANVGTETAGSTLVPTFAPPSPTQPSLTLEPPTATPLPTATPPPCDLVKFVKDITIPDNSELNPGKEFVKTWRLQNVGTCTWTTDYGVTFTGGDAMGAPALVALSSSVAPGETVDVSVPLKSPSDPGTYRGEYKMRNAAGWLFGLGDGSKPFWVQIKVKVQTGLLYDFLSQAKNAKWVSGAGNEAGTDLAFNGDDNDPNGVAKIKDAVKLETGATSGKILLTYPKHVDEGFVSGLYPVYKVQSGDRLKGKLGFLLNPGDVCGAGKVKFRILYKDGDNTSLIKEWSKSCNGSFADVDINLSDLKGKSVQFIIEIRADGSSQDDWAIWNSLRIVQ